jgi:hypothetical protein
MCDSPFSCRDRSSQAACRGSHVASPPRICAIPLSFCWGNHTNSQRVAHVATPTNHESRATSHEPRATSHEPRATSHEPRATNTSHEHEPLKKALSSQTTLFLSSLNITLDFTGTKATSANINSFYFAVDDSADTLDIRFPGFFRFQVGMADIHAAHCSFTTDFAKVCHWLHLPAPSQYNI